MLADLQATGAVMFVRSERAAASRFRSLMLAGLAAIAVTWPGAAAAQSLFQTLFDGLKLPSAFQLLPPRGQAYADPASPAGAPTSQELTSLGVGQSVAYCVRLCDGRYFPIQHHAAATPIQLCGALCPASKTKVFSGFEIRGAVANDGSRYTDLANAFVFRERLVANCTCNGKDVFGLAPLNVTADPTLRPGDMVTTEKGLMTVTAGTPKKGQTVAFAPVNKANMSADLRRKLSAVTPAPGR
jgi:hypothetical protein